MNSAAFSRAVSSLLCAALAFAAPGLPSYAAAADVVNLRVATPQTPATMALPPHAMATAPASTLGRTLSGLGPIPLLGVTAAPSARTARAAASLSAVTARVAPTAALQPVAQEVSAALESVGEMSQAAPSSLNGLGRRLEAALSGAPASIASDDPTDPVSVTMGGIAPSGSQFARPAGDLIRQAVEAGGNDAASVASSVEIRPSAPTPRGPNGPFWPKLLSAGLALAPAALLGWPLLAAGSTLMGGLVLAGSLALAVMPFLSETSPKVLKTLPGFALTGLGVAAIASGLYWPGAFAAVGGWALGRYGAGTSGMPHNDTLAVLSAYFGGVSALTLVALAAATPAGWLASALPYVAYPVSTLLWLHLPSWVGYGFANAIFGLPLGVRGLTRVMTAVHRDTVLLERLEKFSRRYWEQSKWNAVWLAVMWTPIVLFEALKWLTGAALGVFTAVVQAPVNFLWGASIKLFPKSKVVVYFAEASRFVFDNLQNGKIARFNPLESKVLPLANSTALVQRVLGSLALTTLQAGWVVYTLVGAPLLSVAGLITAFARSNAAYSAKRHDPGSLGVDTNDLPSKKPSEPTEPAPTDPVKATVAPKLIATVLALVPAVYFGLPLVTALSVKALLYAALVLPLAAMPFMGPKTPSWLKLLPGQALRMNGLVLFFSGHAIILGILATLGGWGFARYADSRDDGKDHRFDDSAELGAFFGALGSSVAIGAAWMGLMGPWGWAALGFAAVTSPFLLMHLPGWVFFGLFGALRAFPKAMGSWHDGVSFWGENGRFLTHLKDHASYWLNKTYWNGVWLSVIWVPIGLVLAAELGLSVTLGAVSGLLRAPLGFLAEAFQEARPNGKAAVFFRAAAAASLESAEGSKSVLDKMLSPFKTAVGESSALSGRPTLKAVGALFLARVAQFVWMVGAILMNVTGAALVVGLVRGAKAAFSKAPPSDPDAPAEASLRLPGTDRRGLWEVGVGLLGLALAANLLALPGLAAMTLLGAAGVVAIGRLTAQSSLWARLTAAAALLPMTTYIGVVGLANGTPLFIALGILGLIANAALGAQIGSTKLLSATQTPGRRMTALGALLLFASTAAIWVMSAVAPGIAVGLAGSLALLVGFVVGAALVMLSLIGSLRGN